MKRLMILLLAAMTAGTLKAQDWSLSTNIAAYADFGTLNAEVGYAFSRHWNAAAAVRYNPFTFESDGEPVQSRQRTFAAGARYWPWHIYSGWWLSGKMQYQEFNEAEPVSLETSEGDRYGAGIAGGYSKMLGRHLNLDIGIGLWTGYTRYVTYACPTCGRIIGSDDKLFVLPNDLMIALSYIF